MLRRGLHSLGLEEKLPRIVAVDHERLIVTTETVGELASPSLKGRGEARAVQALKSERAHQRGGFLR